MCRSSRRDLLLRAVCVDRISERFPKEDTTNLARASRDHDRSTRAMIDPTISGSKARMFTTDVPVCPIDRFIASSVAQPVFRGVDQIRLPGIEIRSTGARAVRSQIRASAQPPDPGTSPKSPHLDGNWCLTLLIYVGLSDNRKTGYAAQVDLPLFLGRQIWGAYVPAHPRIARVTKKRPNLRATAQKPGSTLTNLKLEPGYNAWQTPSRRRSSMVS